MATVLITGGTGLIGNALTDVLTSKGYSVIVLTRKLPVNTSANVNVQYALWDIEKSYIDENAWKKADYIVHLAGANVFDQRWTENYKKTILESRTKTGKLISEYVDRFPEKIRAVISSSAIGWYGPDKDGMAFTEEAPADENFLGQTCRLWEESLQPIVKTGKRLVIVRTGIVLSKRGGAYAEFRKPVAMNVSPIFGSGKQIVSWIHINDLCNIFVNTIENEIYEGVYNAVAPHPVSNRHLVALLAQSLGKKFTLPLPLPTFLLKIILGEGSIEILKSTTVSCQKLLNAGFIFRFNNIQEALNDLAPKN